MSQSNIAILVYVIGIIMGTLFMDIWGTETNIIKGLMALVWSTLLLISLFYADRKEK